MAQMYDLYKVPYLSLQSLFAIADNKFFGVVSTFLSPLKPIIKPLCQTIYNIIHKYFVRMFFQ